MSDQKVDLNGLGRTKEATTDAFAEPRQPAAGSN